MLDTTLAQKLIEHITRYTEYNVNIMDRDGIIIASRNPERIGTYHEPAWKILHGGEDIIPVASDTDYPGVSRGINMVIDIDGRREGVVGVTGEPEEIRPVALIIKMSIETMIKYEEQKMRSLRRQTKKERLLALISGGEHADPAELRTLLQELGYESSIPRVCILCRTENSESRHFLHLLKENSLCGSEDLSFCPDEGHALLFRGVAASGDGMRRCPSLSMQDALLSGYVEQISDAAAREGLSCRFFIGTLQDHPSLYHASLHHCRWLEKESGAAGAPIVWFTKNVRKYLAQSVPFRELQQIFGAYADGMSEDAIRHCRELTGSLIACDFSITAAAQKLYMHKNTFSYQYSRLLETLGLDPRSDPEDKWLLMCFYLYLTRACGEGSGA
ncbi:MAG TPA: helix-turn-helix domain-containing protein [Candidatus Mediterraneibacter merdipullorum]|nr:helix-turn-helix domain-containing protein [Candidatus Mediterraneibacter merdipullorum]